MAHWNKTREQTTTSVIDNVSEKTRPTPFWASALKRVDALCPQHLDLLAYHYVMLRHVMLCHVTSFMLCPPPFHPSPPPILPFRMEGCPGVEDKEHWAFRELMSHHPIPEPLGDGASGYRRPLHSVFSPFLRGRGNMSKTCSLGAVTFSLANMQGGDRGIEHRACLGKLKVGRGGIVWEIG
jgi:hypothetical protein